MLNILLTFKPYGTLDRPLLGSVHKDHTKAYILTLLDETHKRGHCAKTFAHPEVNILERVYDTGFEVEHLYWRTTRPDLVKIFMAHAVSIDPENDKASASSAFINKLDHRVQSPFSSPAARKYAQELLAYFYTLQKFHKLVKETKIPREDLIKIWDQDGLIADKGMRAALLLEH